MSSIRGTVQDGHIETEKPLDFPNGTEVDIVAVAEREGECRLQEDLAAWLQWVDTFEPVVFTDAEWAAWQQARDEQRRFEIENFDKRCDEIDRLFQ